jgi:hypothetical protein
MHTPLSPAEVAGLSLAGLRAERTACRRQLELLTLRSRRSEAREQEALAKVRAYVGLLTDELIARYAADLSLVDSLLEPAYSASVGPVARSGGATTGTEASP